MSRKRKNEDLEKIETLERENKSLKTLTRSLMRQLKKRNRGDDIEIEEDFPLDVVPVEPTCPDCHRGKIILVDLGIKKFSRCEICNWRTKAEKSNG